MRKVVKRELTLPGDRRILAISDIHGHDSYLQALLDKVGFSPEDILFIIGDILEKGPESLRALRRVMALCAGGSVYPSLGNVDALSLYMLDTEGISAETLREFVTFAAQYWGGSLFMEMCGELRIEPKLEDDAALLSAREEIRRQFRPELDFLHGLPTLIETQRFIFVHGGLPTGDVDALVGGDEYPLLKNDAFADQGLCFDKYVVVGHWPVVLYSEKIPQLNPVINKKQRIVSIDGGCGVKREGQLNALIIPNLESDAFSFAAYDALKSGFAKTPQAASENSILIKWTDREIELLERGSASSLVRHRSSGVEVRMPNSFIEETAEGAYCSDFTNYRLEVRPGDRLAVIEETAEGYYAKKDGVIGWYGGELAFRA